MPASLYRLVGKPHHAEPPASAVPEVQEPRVDNDVTSVVTIEIHNENPAPSIDIQPTEVTVDSENVAPIVATDESVGTIVVAKPTWDPSWSKTQLLAVANELNLSVTSVNTKNEIIKALTAATSG